MNKSMKNYFYLTIALLIITSSCKKEEGNNGNELSGTMLKKITNQNGSITEFDYYSDGKIKERRYLEDGILKNSTGYSYNNDTIKEEITHFNVAPNYVDIVEKIVYYNLSPDTTIGISDDGPDTYNLYIFSGDDCGPSKIIEYSFSSLVRTLEYEYTDGNCSETITHTYDSGNSYKSVYIRDDKNSWENSTMPIYIRKNDFGNIIERNIYNSNDSLIDSDKYIYNFNTDNYPVSKRVDYPGSSFSELYDYY